MDRNFQFNPKYQELTLSAPPSKSYSHRAIICASFADGISRIKNVVVSRDVEATINAMKAIGADITLDGDDLVIRGTKKPKIESTLDFKESGSTMRFLIPVLGQIGFSFTGSKRLLERPLDGYKDICGITLKPNQVDVKHTITPSRFNIDGNLSSQFVSGLLFLLPILDGDSIITLDNQVSKPYINMTIDCLEQFGISIEWDNDIHIKGNQKYIATEYEVEGDYSLSSFYIGMGLLNGDVSVVGLPLDTYQGDKVFIDYIKKMNGNIEIGKTINSKTSMLLGNNFDLTDNPDLLMPLAILAANAVGVTKISGIESLRYKESDRIETTLNTLQEFGVNAYYDKQLIIEGKAILSGGDFLSFNDHRIAMMIVAGSLVADKPCVIQGIDCINKSHPGFFDLGIGEEYEANN